MKNSNIQNAIDSFDEFAKAHGGCSDGGCVFKLKRGGQVTNGGCRCGSNLESSSMNHLARIARRMRDAINEEK